MAANLFGVLALRERAMKTYVTNVIEGADAATPTTPPDASLLDSALPPAAFDGGGSDSADVNGGEDGGAPDNAGPEASCFTSDISDL